MRDLKIYGHYWPLLENLGDTGYCLYTRSIYRFVSKGGDDSGPNVTFFRDRESFRLAFITFMTLSLEWMLKVKKEINIFLCVLPQ